MLLHVHYVPVETVTIRSVRVVQLTRELDVKISYYAYK